MGYTLTLPGGAGCRAGCRGGVGGGGASTGTWIGFRIGVGLVGNRSLIGLGGLRVFLDFRVFSASWLLAFGRTFDDGHPISAFQLSSLVFEPFAVNGRFYKVGWSHLGWFLIRK